MSKKDFFRIIVKMFGLYSLVVTLFQVLPSLINMSVYEPSLWSLSPILGSVAILSVIYIFFLRKPDLIINRLSLEKGFDDPRIELGNLDANKLVSFALILIGGFLVVDYFPSFLNAIYLVFKESVQPKNLDSLMNSFNSGTQYYDLGISILNILIGYLLLTNYQNVAGWILNINAKNQGED